MKTEEKDEREIPRKISGLRHSRGRKFFLDVYDVVT